LPEGLGKSGVQVQYSGRRCLVRHTLFLALMVSVLACRPKLDDETAALKVPASLPVFVQEPMVPSIVHRATELANEATVSLARHDVAKAIPLLTEALTVDGSHEQARWLLAQTFLAGGRGSVALKLIAPLAEHQKVCGWCLEFLQKVKKDKAFERLVQSSEGHALLADVSETPMPYTAWAKSLATAIQTGKLEEVAKYAHISLPFDLVRSCPECEDVSKRLEQRRPLLGQTMLAKVASRFDPVRPENLGVPLSVEGEPRCEGRCCTWLFPKSVRTGTAALSRMCLRPTAPDHPTLSEIHFVYGAPTTHAQPTTVQ
jgi:hypothetical protein